jgi:hypothetical protein
LKKVLDNTSTIGYTIIITINKETKMRKGNQWEIIKAKYEAVKDCAEFPRLGAEYGDHAGRIDPNEFIREVLMIAPWIKSTSIDRHRRKLELQNPSNREAA